MGDCNQVKLNMGPSQCNKLPGRLVSHLSTPENFSIPLATMKLGAAAVLAYINAATLASQATRAFKFPDYVSFENISKEAAYEDTVYTYTDVDPGQARMRVAIRENICTHKALYTHKAYSGRTIFFDHLGQIFGTEKSDKSLAGFRINLLNPEPWIWNDGTVASKSPMIISLKSQLEINGKGLLYDFEGLDGEIYRIIDLEIEQQLGTTASKVKIRVTSECDGTGIEGLLSTDFIFKKSSDGSTQTIATRDDLGNGYYDLNGTAFVDGPLTMKPASTLSIKPYELLETFIVDIPT